MAHSYLWRLFKIPAGTITQLERFKKLQRVKELLEEGATTSEIANDIGVTVQTTRRYIQYLDDIAVADLGNEELAKRREELYLELLEATAEARAEYQKYAKKNDVIGSRKFHMSWLESLKLRASLYGLDNLKIGALTQINQQFNLPEPAKINKADGEKIARLIKKNHEQKRRQEHEEKV